MENRSKARFQSLTGVRFIAVCLVFIYHNRKYWRESLHPEVIRLFNEFHVGVSLFFVLSGFLIAYTYEDKPLASRSAYFKYFLVRCARILPCIG
jgi:peptidoglycan/LPS O-acetylase OafA/YrhL